MKGWGGGGGSCARAPRNKTEEKPSAGAQGGDHSACVGPTAVTASTSDKTQGLTPQERWRRQSVRRLAGRQWPPDAKPTPHAPLPRPRHPTARAQPPPGHQRGGAEQDCDCRARARVVACVKGRGRQARWRAAATRRPLAEGGRRGAKGWRADTKEVGAPATPSAGADTRANRRLKPAARSAPQAAASAAADTASEDVQQ